MTTGEVQVDGSSVRGNSALFSGSLVQSQDAISNLQFSDGTTAIMRPGATMTVYRERSVLKMGVTMQRGLDKHPVIANGLRISGATPNAIALIGVKDASHLEVAAQEGETDVWTSTGNLVARVEPGKTLTFALLAAGGAPANGVQLHGILQPHDLLKDEQTNVTYQLQGSGLHALVGTSVEVTGTVLGGSPTAGTPPVVAVSNAVVMNNDYVATAEGQQGGASPTVTGHAWNKSSTIFLIVVAIGGILLGLGASGAFSSSPRPVTPATP
jgi:hypothetical protein